MIETTPTGDLQPAAPARFDTLPLDDKLLRAVADGGAQFVTMEDAAREYDKRSPFSG